MTTLISSTARPRGAGPRALVVCALFCALAADGAAHAGGFSISILGGRRTGMQAMLGAPDDITALFHNPAGLADQPGTRFHLSGSTTFFSTEFQLRPLDATRFPEINARGCETNNTCRFPVNPQTGFYDKPISPESYFGVLPYLGVSQDLGGLGGKWKDVVVSFAVTAPGLYGANLPLAAPTAYNFVKGYFGVVSAIAGAG